MKMNFDILVRIPITPHIMMQRDEAYFVTRPISAILERMTYIRHDSIGAVFVLYLVITNFRLRPPLPHAPMDSDTSVPFPAIEVTLKLDFVSAAQMKYKIHSK